MIRRLLPICALALLTVLSGCDASNAPPKQAKTAPGPVPLGQLPASVVPEHYRLTLTINPKAKRFRGHDEIAIAVAKPTNAIYLHGLDIHIDKAIVRFADGATAKLSYKQVAPSGVVRVTSPRRIPAGKATLVFDYDAPFGSGLAGLYKVSHAGLPYAFTQFEPTDARRMFPCFDQPGFKTPFDVVVNAPKNDIVIANTPVKSRNATGGGMYHWVFDQTPKLPTYLLALAVGPFDVVNAGTIPPDKYRKQPIRLRGITVKGEGAQIRYALSFTPRIVRTLETYFHMRYPFAKLDMIAVPDFAAGAMENAGAITFRERYMLMGRHAPLRQRLASLVVQAHELTHQWFGDLVTPKWWDDIWLNESFANWMEAKAAAAVMPVGALRRMTLDNGLDVMGLDELPSARKIHNPVKGAADIANIFDAITYDKGAAVLAMFEHYVGKAAWQKAIHAYLTKYAYGNASAQDFIETVATVTHHPEIVAAFKSYIDQAGIPDLSVVLRCDDSASLSVIQTMYAQLGRMVPDRQWKVPMCISGPGVTPMCRIVTRTADVKLGKTCPAYVIPNAGGTGYYRYTYNAKGWRSMIKAAPDLDAADQRTLFANLYAALRAGQASAKDFFAAATAMAPNAKFDLVGAMTRSFHGLRIHLLTDKDREAYENYIRTTFGPRLKAIGLRARRHETAAVRLERAALVKLLVEEGRDPATLQRLTKAADVYVTSGEKSLDGLSPDLVQEAMRAAIITKGTVFGDQLMDAYQASKDDYFHHSVLYAVAASRDPKFLDSVFDMALTPKMHIGDIRYLYAYMGEEPAARAALWDWFKAHYNALLKRVTAEGMVQAPEIFSDACNEDARQAVENFFRPKVTAIPGLKRELDLTEENIDRCIAFKDTKANAMRTALAAAAK